MKGCCLPIKAKGSVVHRPQCQYPISESSSLPFWEMQHYSNTSERDKFLSNTFELIIISFILKSSHQYPDPLSPTILSSNTSFHLCQRHPLHSHSQDDFCLCSSSLNGYKSFSYSIYQASCSPMHIVSQDLPHSGNTYKVQSKKSKYRVLNRTSSYLTTGDYLYKAERSTHLSHIAEYPLTLLLVISLHLNFQLQAQQYKYLPFIVSSQASIRSKAIGRSQGKRRTFLANTLQIYLKQRRKHSYYKFCLQLAVCQSQFHLRTCRPHHWTLTIKYHLPYKLPSTHDPSQSSLSSLKKLLPYLYQFLAFSLILGAPQDNKSPRPLTFAFLCH